MKRILLFLMMGMFLLSLASAQEFVYQQNTDVGIKIICINNGFCSSGAVCNVSIFDPDSIVLLNGVSANQSTNLAFFNVSLNNTHTAKLGEYRVAGFCKDGSVAKEIDFRFNITPNGDLVTTAEAIIQIVLIMGVLFILLLVLWGGIALPFKNRRNDASEIIEVEKLKYFKISLLFLSYVLLVWLVNLLLALSSGFPVLFQFAGFFGIIFKVLNAFSYVAFVVMVVFMCVLAWRDLKLVELLKSGFNPK